MLVIIGLLFPVLQLSAFCRPSALCWPARASMQALFSPVCATLSLIVGSLLSIGQQRLWVLMQALLFPAFCNPFLSPIIFLLQVGLQCPKAGSLSSLPFNLSCLLCQLSALSLTLCISPVVPQLWAKSKDLRPCLSSSLSSCLITISLHPPGPRWPSSLVAGSISTLLLHKFICSIPYRSDLPATARMRSFLWVSCPNTYHFWDSVLL